MNKVLKGLLMLAIVAGAFVATDASAFFGRASQRFMKAFNNVRTMVLIFGGFGLIVLAVAAILGKIKWSALGALAAGLAIVAVAGKVVQYATGQEDDASTNWTDIDNGGGNAG